MDLAIQTTGPPALVLALWGASTLGWWAFAFAPVPPEPPAWLAAARAACFGAVDGGLPAAAGWMMLVLAPASFLAGIVALWGPELPSSLRRSARRRLGQAVLAAFAVAVAVEGVWVAGKVRAAWAVAAWDAAPRDEGPLPSAYPRQVAPAPDFALVDQHGARVSLAGLAGRPVVLTFVFGHCQTLCPLVVTTLVRAVPEGSDVLLVTLDPWRDTPATLAGIARQWGLPPAFRLLSARTAAEVLRVAEAYAVSFRRDERTGDIVHPALVFLIDGEGRLAYTFNNPPAAWVREGVARLGRPGRTHVRAG
jgi:cytochrome oxidase Cu insertion factor (SCO1/SenC/PrrC family)